MSFQERNLVRRGMCVEKAIGSASWDRLPGFHVPLIIFHFSLLVVANTARTEQRATTHFKNTQRRVGRLIKTAQWVVLLDLL